MQTDQEQQQNQPGHQEANEQSSQNTGKNNQQGSAGEDEQGQDSNSSDVGTKDERRGAGQATGTNGNNDEKADNTLENARQVRNNDDSEGEE